MCKIIDELGMTEIGDPRESLDTGVICSNALCNEHDPHWTPEKDIAISSGNEGMVFDNISQQRIFLSKLVNKIDPDELNLLKDLKEHEKRFLLNKRGICF